MSTVSSTSDSSAQSIYQSLTASNSSSSSTSSITDTENRFLTLLTTQLKNQDPLNPVDSAQTTSQLAQISTVQGIETLNTTLKSLLTQYQSSQTLQTANLVGKSVLVDGNQLKLSSSQAVGGFTLGADADTVKISILDSSGTEIDNETLSNQTAGSHDFVWDGSTANGSIAADGTYTVKITASKGTDSIDATALEFATVTSVTNDTSGATIQAGRFSNLNLSDIRLII